MAWITLTVCNKGSVTNGTKRRFQVELISSYGGYEIGKEEENANTIILYQEARGFPVLETPEEIDKMIVNATGTWVV